jgi:hypothetical protein
MDPLTAALQLATVIAEIIKTAMADQPPDVKAALWKEHLADVQAWREFWQKFIPKP